MTVRPFIDTLMRVIAWIWHHLVLVTAACIFLIAVGVLGLRYWFLPNIGDYRESIAQWVSKSAGQKVTIGELTADWEGLRPRLNLGDVRVYDKAGNAALILKRVDSTVSWRSLALWRPAFRSIDIYEPALDVRRSKAGVITVAGIEMGGEAGEGGFSDWALSQRDIEIHKAAIDWTDDMRGAPTLQLREVFARVVNRGDRHRFGVKARVPDRLAGPLDVRGDLTGKTIKNPADWNGRVYVNVDQVDIAAWRTWAPLPFEVSRGEGALRAWVVVRDLTLREMIADVKLANVRARPNKDLPELELTALNGRVMWKRNGSNLEVSTTQMGFTTAGNLRLPPMSMRYKATLDAAGKATTSDVTADAIEVGPLTTLTDHLPMDAETRKRIEAVAPRGRLADVHVHWEGGLPAPKSFTAKGRFENVTVNALNALPGLQGLSGSIEASNKGGNLQIKSKGLKLDMPQLFKAALDFDNFAGQATWTHGDKGYQVKLSNVAFANADVEGTVNGTYQTLPEGPGMADITGQLTRADAAKAMRYMPLPVAQGAREWLDAAFVAGKSNDVKFKVKGNLYDFPFEDDKNGTFSVLAKVKDGTLHYATGWPDISGIEADLAFHGKRMEIAAREGAIAGVRLSGVKADIADLGKARVLIVNGDAEGQTPQFLKFIEASPVSGYIDHFTDGMQAEGPGKLKLRLELPLQNLDKTRVAGNYQLTGNRVLIDSSMPPMEQATGTIEFNEMGVSVPSANATFFGGPLSVSGGTQRDGTIRIALKGRADPETVRRAGGSGAWLNQLRGATDWQGSVTVRKKTVEVVIDSTLQGIASTLPAPLAKTATEAVPLRLERRYVGQDRDQVVLTYGDILSARLNRHSEGKRTIIDRGAVRLGGGTAGEPVRDGVVVSGSLKAVNLDDWLKFSSTGSGAGSGASSDIVYRLTGVDLKLGEFDLYERKFGELTVAATAASNADTMRYRLMGRDIEGTVDWTPQGRGRVVAQLQKLMIPAGPDTRPGAPRGKPVVNETAQLPALDIVADQFQLGAKPLGKLELRATQQDRDWRIEQLRLTHADGILTASGVWQSWLTQPRTEVNVQWGILNVGSTLGRLGYPDAVRRGIAELGGTLSWDGNPYQIDYPSLSGKFVLRAANGQFAKLEPGLGKLLGIISLQSIPRRLRLDFRDVFTEGFAFDEIVGEVKIDRGIAASDKFLVSGPSAKVLMGGTVDLARETQELQVKVSPNVTEGVAIASAFVGGPIAALATYVVGKLLKDPFNEAMAYRYNVTGTWADPVVARVPTPAMPERPSE